jgi:hypothetical protein
MCHVLLTSSSHWVSGFSILLGTPGHSLGACKLKTGVLMYSLVLSSPEGRSCRKSAQTRFSLSHTTLSGCQGGHEPEWMASMIARVYLSLMRRPTP